MMRDLWSVLCGDSDCAGNACFSLILNPSSCINNVVVICVDVLLLLLFLFSFICKASSRTRRPLKSYICLKVLSSIYNGCLGLAYCGSGIWVVAERLRRVKTVLPLHGWLVLLLQGVTWLCVGLTVSLRGRQISKGFLWAWSVVTILFAAALCVLSVLAVVLEKEVFVKNVLDVLSFPGGILLLLCTFYEHNGRSDNDRALYTPLNGENSESSEIRSGDNVTPFAKAGIFSRMTFGWLSPLMKKGKEKTLEDEDIPGLDELDRAKTCYLSFVDHFNKQKQKPVTVPSILRALFSWQWKGLVISGVYAVLKVVSLSAGPLLLNGLIAVAEAKGKHKYKGYVLAAVLLLSKFVESLSQRQWFFRSRTVGLQVRSYLLAAIYVKQLKHSNAAKSTNSAGEVMSYVTVDAYRIGEFPYWFHQTWSTVFQLCLALMILVRAIGLATIAAMFVIVLTVICNAPLARLQHKFLAKLTVAQDERLKTMSEALVNMKILKLYAWETHFRKVVEGLREKECKCLSSVQMQKAYNSFLFWSSPILVSAAAFGSCYFLGVPLNARNVFTFVATLRLVQEPVRSMPDVIAVVIQANVSLERIVKFLDSPELQSKTVRRESNKDEIKCPIVVKSANFSWEENPLKPTLRNINLEVRTGEKVAICGEVGSGKSTLLSAILGEVPNTAGTIQVCGEIAYVSQMAWIQTGTIQDNILFGSSFDRQRYQETLERCSLVKDLEMMPFGDLTQIGERGVNLSGGQKQRIQLARALYQNADIYLLDDPFSAVDAHTATNLFNDYAMEALSGKTVLLVTHQVDFLPAFDSVLLMSAGEIRSAGPYNQLLAFSHEFRALVDAHKETAGSESANAVAPPQRPEISSGEVKKSSIQTEVLASTGNQLIKQEERETGDTGLRPYIQYLNQDKGFLFFVIACVTHLAFVIGQVLQNSWMASNVQKHHARKSELIIVYLVIGFVATIFLFIRSISIVSLGMQSSRSIFSQLQSSLFRAPVSFYDSTPLGRILSRVSSDLGTVDLDIAFGLIFSIGAAINTLANIVVLIVITWPVVFVAVLMIYLTFHLQGYYLASARELMRINGTTKSALANHLAETIAGAMTIRAFKKEDRFVSKNFDLIDKNASPYFHYFSANEWLIERLEILGAIVMSASVLALVLLPPGTISAGYVGMALSYGLSLNMTLIFSIQNQCAVANDIISVERLNQYMHLPSEAPEVIEGSRPEPSWPAVGKVELIDLKIRYRPDAPLVLRGITCTFEGGHKIGIVGRTGSGKSTLIGALFRLVEPAGGKIIIDNLDITTIGLHDLRSRFGIIPQDPTLFNGTVRYNLDPLSQHSDDEIWEVLGKCQLQAAVREKEVGLDALVSEEGSNWSMGQRQLFCLGRALLRRSRLLVLDEATASIDNATDAILQKTIRTEFADCTVITVAHRIPTVMDCTEVLAMSDGQIVEYDEPMKLMEREGSLFGRLVKEYWSHMQSASSR
ncbi:hypothetical protein Scep_006087 [Stephania cephalantha]|uniref:ABC transporter C family member 10 n=1 Tax=Stephania cephalantha TaxID=152367 RepID=A0AAP0KA07_9MAGN